MKKTDCIVIGAGIAGMTAAIYLKRSNVDFIIVEKGAPGGVMNRTSKIENYPGVLDSDGVNLSLNMYQQLQNLKVNYLYGTVEQIELKDEKKIVTIDAQKIEAKTVIIAPGRIPRKLNLEGEEGLVGKGISWCAICDGAFYKDKDVAVIGSGNAAYEEALYLSSIVNQVYLFCRKNSDVEEALKEKVLSLKNVIIKNNQIKQLIIKEKFLKGVILENNQKLDLEGIFVFTGYDPLLTCIEKLDIRKDNNYLVVNKQMETSIKGIFACGDVIKKDVYQLTTAVGEASIAATFVKRYLDMKKA